MGTRAIKRGDSYVINGSKTFITGGSVADTIVVFARTDQNGDAPARDISAFIVEKTMPGFKVGKVEKKMGIRGSPTAQLFFEDLAVPAANRLGHEGEGFKLAMRVLDHSRPGIAAQALGIAEGAFDLARRYARDRRQFGKPIMEFQGIQFMLADMATQIEAARDLTYAAAYYGAGRSRPPLLGSPGTGKLTRKTTPEITAAPRKVPAMNDPYALRGTTRRGERNCSSHPAFLSALMLY